MALSSGGEARAMGVGAGNLLCMLSMLVWAAGFPAAELLLGRWDPFLLTAARFVLSAGALTGLWLALGGVSELRAAALAGYWRKALWIGGAGFGLGALLLLTAQDMTDPVTVAVIATAMPIAGAGLEIALDGRRLTRALAFGAGLALIGGLVASGALESGGPAALDAVGVLGGALALASVVVFCWGSRATARALGEVSQLGRTAVTMIGGALFALPAYPLAWALGLADAPHAPGLEDVGPMALYALGAMALAQILWLLGVRGLGVAVASMHMNAAPFYVMLFMLTLGEPWRWDQAAGALLVALGAAIGQAPARRRAV